MQHFGELENQSDMIAIPQAVIFPAFPSPNFQHAIYDLSGFYLGIVTGESILILLARNDVAVTR